ncbi:MAG: hypothetical protein CSB16_00990 [Clostridiales bacterium]|nr:MAG: hypothetical protein CSB16_00990 [Clostridiales bacterium]
MKIVGKIEHFIYKNNTNGYGVAVVNSSGDKIKAVGTFLGYDVADRVEIEGEIVFHKKYGEQIKINKMKRVFRSKSDRLITLITASNISGIGKSQARRIVEYFGEETLEIFESDIDRLIEVRGIGEITLEKIKRTYVSIVDRPQVLFFLQNMNISDAFIPKILAKYSEDAERIIRDNPYVLCFDIPRFGFLKADELARRLEYDNSENRAKAFVFSFMNTRLQRGDVFVYLEELEKVISENLEVDSEKIVDDMMRLDHIIVDNNKIYLKEPYMCEQTVASSLYRISQNIDRRDIESDIIRFENEFDISLNSEQKNALRSVFSSGVTVITGGPGTGKTTLIKAIVYIAGEKNTGLCAPTGRAAKRMESAGKEAKTIHRMLEYKFDEDSNSLSFERNENYPLDYDIIIVDEASMIDIFIMSALLRATGSYTRLVIIGDTNQLPSVGAGRVLNDIIESEKYPVETLSVIYRQTSRSVIPFIARNILRGEVDFFYQVAEDFMCETLSSVNKVYNYIQSYVSELDRSELRNIQFLTPMKKGKLGTRQLNKFLQKLINPDDKLSFSIGEREFKLGDRVMQVKNDYNVEWVDLFSEEKGMGIFNGDIGEIEEIFPESRSFKIVFDDMRVCYLNYEDAINIEHSYAITIHKSQGNEFSKVVLVIGIIPPLLANRSVFYTGITRASDELVLLGSKKDMINMTMRISDINRNTSLKERINSYY